VLLNSTQSENLNSPLAQTLADRGGFAHWPVALGARMTGGDVGGSASALVAASEVAVVADQVEAVLAHWPVALGARMTGGDFGGSASALVAASYDQDQPSRGQP